MNVGLYVTGVFPPWLGGCIKSIRAAMPTVPIVQLTDLDTPVIQGVDRAVGIPMEATLSLHRSKLFAKVEGEWLFLDTDVIVQRDVSDVFDHPFDVAVTDRWWSRAPNGQYRAGGQPDFIAGNPYNAGVVFSRCRAFWSDVAEDVWLNPVASGWYGDQMAMCDVALSGRYRVRVLPGQRYNFPPDALSERDLAQASILHFKGQQRKQLLLEHLGVAACQ